MREIGQNDSETKRVNYLQNTNHISLVFIKLIVN